MKHISLKKTLSLFLAAVLAVMLFVPTLAASDKTDADPILIITGFSQYPLVDQDTGEKVFGVPNEDIVNAVIEVLPALATLLASGKTQADYDALCDAALPVVNRLFEPIACNPDGSVKHTNVGLGYQYPESFAEYGENSEAYENQFGNALVQGAVDAVGADKVYVYGLDWRLSPLEIADELQEWILHIKEKTGSDKVSVAGISMGGVMLSTYVAKYGTEHISHITMISSAFTGLEYIGALFTGGIDIDPQGVYNMLTQAIGKDTLSSILGATGILEQALPLVDDLIAHCGDRIYTECLIPAFGFTPGIWSFVPADYYASAKEFMFRHMDATDSQKAALETKLNAYYEIQANAAQTLKAAKAAGVNVAIISNYNFQMPPVSTVSKLTGDQTIETMHTSGYATCAEFGKTLPDSVSGKYVSPDQVIDASTCYLPDETWFIKNMKHVGFSNEQNQCKFYAWLMTTDKQVTVSSNADYPQFLLYNDETKVLSPLGMQRGDVNFDGVINLIDARMALRHARTLISLSGVAKEAADMDANSKITTTDAKLIMSVFLGLSQVEDSGTFSIDNIQESVSNVVSGNTDTSNADSALSGITDQLGSIGAQISDVIGGLQNQFSAGTSAISELPEITLPQAKAAQAEETPTDASASEAKAVDPETEKIESGADAA